MGILSDYGHFVGFDGHFVGKVGILSEVLRKFSGSTHAIF